MMTPDESSAAITLASLGSLAKAAAESRGWGMDWQRRGVYLHLESSEFIEAIRGKGGDPEFEAADVLFVFLSIVAANKLSMSRILLRLKYVIAEVYAGRKGVAVAD